MTEPEFSRADYEAYLASPRWKQFKEAFIATFGDRCELCIDSAGSDLHHWDYRNLTRELFGDVALLCRQCHTETHKTINGTDREIVLSDRRRRGLDTVMGPNYVAPRKKTWWEKQRDENELRSGFVE